MTNSSGSLQLPTLDGDFTSILPPFANEENKTVYEQIKEKQSKIIELEKEIENQSSRETIMLEHMKNVQQEYSHCQAIYEAKNREIKTEEHMKQLADRQIGRLNSDLKTITKNIEDNLNVLQNNIYKVTEEIENSRKDMNIEKKELDEWLRIQNEKEEDTLAILKYQKMDNNKIKEISTVIEKLQQEVARKKNQLNAEVTETQVAQIELDRTTETFRQMHKERQDLISRWEEAVEMMRKRDIEINDAQSKLAESRLKAKEKQAAVNEKQQFMDQQMQNNKELEKKIEQSDRLVGKYRAEQQETSSQFQSFQDEVEITRNTLNKVSNDLATRKIEINNLRVELQERQKKLEKDSNTMQTTKEELQKANDKSISLEEKSKQLQNILKNEENKLKALEKETKIVKDLQFKKSQELFKLRQLEKDITAEINGTDATLKNWAAKIVKLDQQAQKQQELIYNQDFQIQQLERKIRRAQGERTDEEKELLTKKISDLQTVVDDLAKKSKILASQYKRSQDDHRLATRLLQQLENEKISLHQSVDDLTLYNDSAARQLSSKQREKEELMVEENISRLELRRLRQFLNSRADEVYSLEARQVQLQTALEERQKEIEIHKDILKAQIKNAEENKSDSKSKLREQVGKVDKLKRKYEILVTRFAPEDGEAEHSQAFYVIKAAQQREELQREGDTLDAQIRRAEKEVRALENTLELMNSRNSKFRESLHQPDSECVELRQKEILEKQIKSANEKLSARKFEIEQFQLLMQNLDTDLRENNLIETNLSKSILEKETVINALMRELSEQDNKKNRSTQMLSKVSKQMKSEDKTTYEAFTKDLSLKELKEANNNVLYELEKLSKQDDSVRNILRAMYQQHGFDMNENVYVPESRNRSRASSQASVVRPTEVTPVLASLTEGVTFSPETKTSTRNNHPTNMLDASRKNTSVSRKISIKTPPVKASILGSRHTPKPNNSEYMISSSQDFVGPLEISSVPRSFATEGKGVEKSQSKGQVSDIKKTIRERETNSTELK